MIFNQDFFNQSLSMMNGTAHLPDMNKIGGLHAAVPQDLTHGNHPMVPAGMRASKGIARAIPKGIIPPLPKAT